MESWRLRRHRRALVFNEKKEEMRIKQKEKNKNEEKLNEGIHK